MARINAYRGESGGLGEDVCAEPTVIPFFLAGAWRDCLHRLPVWSTFIPENDRKARQAAALCNESRQARRSQTGWGDARYSVGAMDLEAKVLTVSESVHAGVREDRSGEALVATLVRHGFRVVQRRTVPDGVEPVSAALSEMTAAFQGLVVTTGGTGFSPTDLTPEATRAVLEREAPGLAEATRATNPLGRLSRGVAGTVGACVVLNVPGSPSGAVEAVEAVLDVLPHALELLAGGRPH